MERVSEGGRKRGRGERGRWGREVVECVIIQQVVIFWSAQ